MKPSRTQLEADLADYENQLNSLNSFLQALQERTEEYGTGREHFEADLTEAQHNIKYYEGEIARIKKELGTTDGGLTSYLPKPDGNSLVLASITFLAGILVGYGLNAWNESRDSRSR